MMSHGAITRTGMPVDVALIMRTHLAALVGFHPRFLCASWRRPVALIMRVYRSLKIFLSGRANSCKLYLQNTLHFIIACRLFLSTASVVYLYVNFRFHCTYFVFLTTVLFSNISNSTVVTALISVYTRRHSKCLIQYVAWIHTGVRL